MVQICLNKNILKGSTTSNYKTLKVLPVRSLYKHLAILNESEKNIFNNTKKREIRAYDIQVDYSKKYR